MFIAETSIDGLKFSAHETRAAAIQCVIDTLGSDYADHFWLENGELQQSTRFNDFTARVHNGLTAAVDAFRDYDPEAQAVALRALADMIEVNAA